MVSIRHMQTGYNAGEISPMLLGRVDTDHHAFGLEVCENFVPRDEGPIVKRPGFMFIRDADPTASWLSAFRRSITQEYLLELGEHKLRFYTNGGRIETGPTAPYEVTTPYPASVAPALSMQQSYDRLYIDHAGYPPASLSRTGATTFTYAVSAFTNGPFADQNSDKTVTVTVSAASGTGITVAASSAIFQAGHVGSLFRIEAEDFAAMPAWEAGMAGVYTGMQVRSDGKIYEAQTDGSTGSVQPIHTSGTYSDGMSLSDVLNNKGPYGVRWLYLGQKFGTVKITGFIDAQHVTADVVMRLPDALITEGTWRWAHAEFSAAAGYPGLVKTWKGRQIHFKGLDIVASVVGDYLDHTTFTDSGLVEEDLAFRRTIDAPDPPLWVSGDTSLLAGTASTEMAIGPVNTSAAFSGSNISSDPQSYYGSEPVWPVNAGTATLFVERGGTRLRATDFNLGRNRYIPDDLTATAQHIAGDGLLQLAYQRVPQAMVHAVRADGQIVTHPYTKADIKGFCRLVPGGGAQVLSAASIVGADGKTDELWVLITRDTPGGTRREIWKQAPWQKLDAPITDAYFVDGGVQATVSAGQTHFSGLVHLAGQEVAVLANGSVISGLTVNSDGTLDLPADNVPNAPYVVSIGLAYTATAITVRPEASVPGGGTIQGLKKRIVKVVLRVLQTLGISAGQAGQDLEELMDRPAGAVMGAATQPFTGDTDGAAVQSEFDREGRLQIVSDLPLPAIITSAMLKLDVDAQDV